VEEGVKAVIVEGTLGLVPDMERISETGVPVIEEITSTLGAHTGEKVCGAYGQLVIIRLEAHDLITAAGGTVVLARKRSGYTRLKQLADELPKEAFLPDMNAALARIQLKELDRYFERRKELYGYLLQALRKGRHGTPVQTGEAEPVAYTFPVMVEGAVREVQGYARKKGVHTGRAFTDAVLSFIANGEKANASESENTDEDTSDAVTPEGRRNEFPHAKKALNSCVIFPLYPRLSKEQIDTIAKVLSTLP
jgi:dTDP-4-amino-4,6-dideoxygalactose transaminase